MGHGARELEAGELAFVADHAPQSGRLGDSVRGGLKALARSLGYDVRRIDAHFHKRPIDFIRSRNIDVVVDIGANVGQYAARLRSDGYTGWIVSAEPVGAVYEILAARAAGDRRWKTVNFAFGEKEEVAEINVSEASVFSSLRRQRPAAAAFNAESRVTHRERVQVARLDDFFSELPRGRAFLKIDTQGYEQQVLMGASRCLSQFLGVQTELPIIHLYEGTWQFHEAVAYMSEHGFEISNIVPVNYDPVDSMSLLEVDCIFRVRRRQDVACFPM
jgi:FkbM family methyltransferase